MKKLKKNEKSNIDWTISYEDLEKVTKVANVAGYWMGAEEVEAVILSLVDLGYLELEE